MRITTWNVNSVRRRLDAILRWIERNRPDVVCLQETKCVDDRFPTAAFESAGYHAAVNGQPAYNGVAILSLSRPDHVEIHPFWKRDPDARSIAATVGGFCVLNVYVPYGEAVGTARFRKKLRWIGRLRRHMVENPSLIVSGDFNVAPDDRDVYDPRGRSEKLICSSAERRVFRTLLEAGYADAFREVSEESGRYTWWSHRTGAVTGNRGLRVDHHLVHESLRSRIREVEIDLQERKRTGASDHAPVTLVLEPSLRPPTPQAPARHRVRCAV